MNLQNLIERVAGLIDQALVSFITLALLLIYARMLPKDEFGVFSLVWGMCLVASGLHRAVVVLPMLVTIGHDFKREGGDWARLNNWVNWLVALLLGACAMLSNFVVPQLHYTQVLALAAPAVWAALSLEFQRRCLFQLMNPRAIILASVAYASANLVAAGIVIQFLPTATAAVMALSASTAMAALSARLLRGPLATSAGDSVAGLIRTHRRIMSWNLLSFVPYSIYNNGMVLIVGVMAGPAGAALFVASRLFTAPVVTLIQAVDSVDKPRARAALRTKGPRGLASSLRRTRLSMMVLGLPYLIAVGLLRDTVVPLALGAQFEGAQTAVTAWLAVAFLMMAGHPLETGLVMMHRTATVFWTRVLAAAASLGFYFLLNGHFGPATPVIGLAVGWTISTIAAWIVLHRSLASDIRTHERLK